MIKRFKTIWSILFRHEKVSLIVLFFLTVFAGLLQAFGVISIFPFIAIVGNQSIIHSNKILSTLYDNLGFSSDRSFLIFIGIAVFLFLLIVNLSQGFLIYRQKTFIRVFLTSLTSRLLNLYLHQPYLFFVKSNSSYLSKKIMEDARYLAEKYFTTFFEFISSVFVSLFLLAILVYTDPVLSISVLGLFGILYGIIHLITKNRLNQEAKNKVAAQKAYFQHLSETFGAVKDIKVAGYEQLFVDIYSKLMRKFSKSQYYLSVLVKIPPLFMDLITFGGIIFVVLVLISDGSDLSSILPVLVLFALAAQRLKPQIQLVFASMAQMQYLSNSIESVVTDFTKLTIPANIEDPETVNMNDEFASIRLEEIEFHYPNSDHNVINKLSLDIPANQTIAFVGSSGSGKTTLIDLILGILQPQAGHIRINGTLLNEHSIRSWQKHIGYIPQHIFLFDDSIAKNIAFGISEKDIDLQRVKEVLDVVNLSELVNSMPEGIHTKVGDRGVRLSGGQRQRIGIARALYRKPSLLVMDEATSALDGITEDQVMESIYRLSGKMTIIMIAHRLTTIKDCDRIHFMKKGNIIQSGTYQELISENAEFRAMAKETAEV